MTKTFFFKTFLFLFLIFNFCCNGCGTQLSNSNVFQKPKATDPRLSFMRIETEIKVQLCVPGEKCIKGSMGSYGSGTIVSKHGKTSYILTAAHVCVRMGEPFPDEITVLDTIMKVMDIDLKKYDAKILAVDTEHDICILKANDIDKPFLHMAKKPFEIGERGINLAAPGAFMGKNLIPIYETIFIGSADGMDLFTTHAYPGSSGSMILNLDYEVVGMLDAVIGKLPTIALSPKFSTLVQFVDKHIGQDCKDCQIYK